MTYQLRFFDDYGSGWLWAANDAARAAFGYGPVDEMIQQQLGLLSPQTLAEGDALSGMSLSTLNMDDPARPLPLTPAFCDDFNHRVAALFVRMCAELGPEFELADRRTVLIPG